MDGVTPWRMFGGRVRTCPDGDLFRGQRGFPLGCEEWRGLWQRWAERGTVPGRTLNLNHLSPSEACRGGSRTDGPFVTVKGGHVAPPLQREAWPAPPGSPLLSLPLRAGAPVHAACALCDGDSKRGYFILSSSQWSQQALADPLYGLHL